MRRWLQVAYAAGAKLHFALFAREKFTQDGLERVRGYAENLSQFQGPPGPMDTDSAEQWRVKADDVQSASLNAGRHSIRTAGANALSDLVFFELPTGW